MCIYISFFSRIWRVFWCLVTCCSRFWRQEPSRWPWNCYPKWLELLGLNTGGWIRPFGTSTWSTSAWVEIQNPRDRWPFILRNLISFIKPSKDLGFLGPLGFRNRYGTSKPCQSNIVCLLTIDIWMGINPCIIIYYPHLYYWHIIAIYSLVN